jgi:hypothetical protein
MEVHHIRKFGCPHLYRLLRLMELQSRNAATMPFQAGLLLGGAIGGGLPAFNRYSLVYSGARTCKRSKSNALWLRPPTAFMGRPSVIGTSSGYINRYGLDQAGALSPAAIGTSVRQPLDYRAVRRRFGDLVVALGHGPRPRAASAWWDWIVRRACWSSPAMRDRRTHTVSGPPLELDHMLRANFHVPARQRDSAWGSDR